mgnify:CR=1 FL=1
MNRKSKTINLMKYIIIGLGNYGHVLAEELSALGHEVIGADISSARVDGLKDKIATAFVIDATDEQALSVLPLNSVDDCRYRRERWRVHSCSGSFEAEKGETHLCQGH